MERRPCDLRPRIRRRPGLAAARPTWQPMATRGPPRVTGAAAIARTGSWWTRFRFETSSSVRSGVRDGRSFTGRRWAVTLPSLRWSCIRASYQGALIECGAIDGVGIADYYLAYKAAAEYFAGVPLLDAIDRPDLSGRISERWLPVLGAARQLHCPGPPLRERDQVPGRRRAAAAFAGAAAAIRHESDLPGARTEPLGRAGSTLHIRYRIDPTLGVDEDELNRKIRRFAPAAGARSREADPVFAELTGRITVPVLAIHETGDARVPFSLQQAYRRRTLAAGTSHLLVQRAIRWSGHCGFEGEVREQAFDDLVAGSNAESSPPETTCWRTTCRSWGYDGHPSSIPTIRRDGVRLTSTRTWATRVTRLGVKVKQSDVYRCISPGASEV